MVFNVLLKEDLIEKCSWGQKNMYNLLLRADYVPKPTTGFTTLSGGAFPQDRGEKPSHGESPTGIDDDRGRPKNWDRLSRRHGR